MIPAAHLPELIASRYRPLRLIATGGMAAVYEAEHTHTGEHVALKVLLSHVGSSADAIERFRREARTVTRIKSEHVVRVTDADVAAELGGAPFLVMELLDGVDLERAAKDGPVAPEVVIAWLRQVAEAIDKAHHLGIVHRDLKPENLFLTRTEGGRTIVKVLDFGIAKMLEEGTGLTSSGQLLGTPKYMAPEQVTPTASITAATDRHALGLIAYRLLMGQSYHQGGVMVILGQILNDDLQPPSERGSRFEGGFDAWFLRACHRDPQRRFPSATEQIDALAAALGLPPLAVEPSPVAQKSASQSVSISERLPRHRSRVIALLLALGLFASMALALLLRLSSGGEDDAKIPPPATPATLPAPPPAPPPSAEMRQPPPRPAPAAPARNPAAAARKLERAPDRPRVSRRRAGSERSVARMKSPTGNAAPMGTDPYADQK